MDRDRVSIIRIQGVVFLFAFVILQVIALVLYSPVHNIEGGISGTSPAAYGIPAVFSGVGVLLLLIGLSRFYVAHKTVSSVDADGNVILDSFSPKDEALQEKLEEESEALDSQPEFE